MKKTFAIISHDRHRDDRVYLVECMGEDVKKYVQKIWDKDFSFPARHQYESTFTDGSGDYEVSVAILGEIEPLEEANS